MSHQEHPSGESSSGRAPDRTAQPLRDIAAWAAARRRAWDLGSAGVRALAVVAVAVAIMAAVIAWRSRPRVEPVVPPQPAGSVASSPDLGGPAAGGAGSGVRVADMTGAPGMIVVAVSGQVQRPGLVRLPAGARVADAIDAAGGALPGTDLILTNLARKVVDGELLVVGPAASALPPPPSSGLAGAAAGPVNLNTATVDQLQTLPGVGPVLAQRILDYRDQHGGFRSVADLHNVSGIGDARFNELKNLVTL